MRGTLIPKNRAVPRDLYKKKRFFPPFSQIPPKSGVHFGVSFGARALGDFPHFRPRF